MEKKLERKLDPDEHVDHIDEDKTNDAIDNLQLLSPSENSSKTARKRFKITWYEFTCPFCSKSARKNFRDVKHNWKMGKQGPFCSKSCASKYQAKSLDIQVVCGTNAMYARGCKCAECRKAHSITTNEWKKRKKSAHVVQRQETNDLESLQC